MGLVTRNGKSTKSHENGNVKSGCEHDENTTCTPANKSKTFECDIPFIEGLLIMTIWSTCLVYIGYCVYLDSDKILNAQVGHRFLPGWKITNRLKDFSNFEWEFWHDFWTQRVWPAILGHIFMNLILGASSQQTKLVVSIIYSCFALWWLLNWKILVCLLFYVSFGYLLAWTTYTAVIWTFALGTLAVISTEYAGSLASAIADDDNLYQRKQALLMFAAGFTALRLVSFGIDWSEHRKRTSVENETDTNSKRQEAVNYSFLKFLHYCLYLPFIFTGPMFNFDCFQEQFWNPRKQWTKESVKTFVLFGLRVVFSYVVCELMLHYMYFNAIYHSEDAMNTVSLWTLAGIGYHHSQFFMVKYVVLFGLPRLLAMTDHLDAPQPPSCVARVGTTIRLWRKFDSGLYLFITKYIYIPVGGGHNGVLWKLIASALGFSFVFMWHGAIYAVFLWVLVNFIDISLQGIAGALNKRPSVQQLQAKYLSKASTRRLKCLLITPGRLFTTIAVNAFFARNETIWDIHVRRLVFEGFPNSLFLCLFFLYCLGLTDYFISSLGKSGLLKNSQKQKDL